MENCGGCKNKIDEGEPSILCDGKCSLWWHSKCIPGMTEVKLKVLASPEVLWLCPHCITVKDEHENKDLLRILVNQQNILTQLVERRPDVQIMPDLNKEIPQFEGTEVTSGAKDWLRTINGVGKIHGWTEDSNFDVP
uniref:PHD-type domain-containing protein n=1 Tax=Rhodnius prolixus TaxID=13249 RepID=T1I4U3_RHOPR